MAEAHTFGRYRVTKPLGAGAMGEVYEAQDEVLGRDVAIKTLRTSGGYSAQMLDDRFRNEARAIAQLSHPGVVQVFDIDLQADPPYLVMERVPGPALDDRLDHGTLPVDELVALGIQIARALAAAHAAGIVHRDVKPGNILAAGAGMWKLADFGIARVPDSSLTITGQFLGSPAYAPPEALVRGDVTPAGDVYGLGATMYEAAAGTWPRLEAKGALLAPVPPVRQLAPHLPPHVAAAIDRAVSFEAARRPTATELAEMLAAGERATPVSVALPVSLPPPPVGAPWPWKRWAVAAGALLLLVILFATRGKSSPTPSPIVPPAAVDESQAQQELQDIADRANSGDIEGAREALDDYADRYGDSPMVKDLRRQLDRALGGPPGKRKHKHGD